MLSLLRAPGRRSNPQAPPPNAMPGTTTHPDPGETTVSSASQNSRRRPRRPRSEDQDDILAREAAKELGRTYPTQFNVEREQRQLVLDAVEGLMPYPSAFRGDDLSKEVKAAKTEYDRTHQLVVIEWGGSKPPGRTWSYSRRQCQEVRKHGLLAELEARRRWDLPVVSAALRAARPGRQAHRRSRDDQESPQSAR